MKRLLYTLMIALPISLCSQTVHDIEAGGGGSLGDPYYSPQFITILVGDIVRWTNVAGTHNVDGRLETFPDNPEGFYSGIPTMGWEFEHTFTIPGEYDFECSAFDHNLLQFGTITVTPVGLGEERQEEVQIFPNPTTGTISIKTTDHIEGIEVFDINSKLLFSELESGTDLDAEVDLSSLTKGSYVIKVTTASGVGYETVLRE